MAAKSRKRSKSQTRTKGGPDAKSTKSAQLAKTDKALREHLLSLLAGENAHLNFDRAVADFPFDLCGLKPDGIPYSAWQILEHLRIAQWDILEFSRNPHHVSPPWPEGYWPAADMPADETAWRASVNSFRADLRAMESLVRSPRTDLFARIPHGDGQTVLREALLVADHNAYHIGQLVLIRRLIGSWSQD
jgi:DinB superfamily